MEKKNEKDAKRCRFRKILRNVERFVRQASVEWLRTYWRIPLLALNPAFACTEPRFCLH